MKRVVERISRCVLAAIFAIGLMPTAAFAQGGDTGEREVEYLFTTAPTAQSDAGKDDYAGCNDETGSFWFTSTPNASNEVSTSCVYSDSWFTGSSYELNRQLATLSASASLASVTSFSSGRSSKNIEAMLDNLGFADISTNAYYNQRTELNSAGCAMGRKTIIDNGKAYTLLAIIPRSAGYGQEWGGNFQTGVEGMHQGFKAGRDEILRFARSYVEEHGISGDVKVWTTGHSRGAALAGSVGAFMARAGSDFLGDGVSLAPEDVYAYAFATPGTIVEGADETQVFSVEGYRGISNPRYAYDTPGDASAFAGTGTVSPHEGVFRAVHNCIPGHDLIVHLPSQSWGFTVFGTEFDITDGSDSTKGAMLDLLEELSSAAYGVYANGGDESDFRWKTFDLATLSFVDDASATEPVSQASFFAARAEALMKKPQTRENYVAGGYQDTLVAVGGIIGLDIFEFIDAVMAQECRGDVVKFAVYGYLAYASERLQAEGRAAGGDEAVALAVMDVVEWVTGVSIDPASFTVDDFIYTMSRYLVDNADISYKVKSNGSTDYTVVKVYAFRSKTAEAAFDKLYEAVPVFSSRNNLMAYLSQCAYGSDHSGASAAKRYRSATFYPLLQTALSGSEYSAIRRAIGSKRILFIERLDGSGLATGLVTAALPRFIDEGTTIEAAADAHLTALIDAGMRACLDSGRYAQGTAYYNDLAFYFEVLKANVSELRPMLLYTLFYDEGVPFSTEASVRNASTLAAQVGKVAPAHYNETYLAWMRAQDAVYLRGLHPLEHVAAVAATYDAAGSSEHWRCTACGKLFADAEGRIEIAAQDLVIADLPGIGAGKTAKVKGNTYKVTSNAKGTVTLTRAKNATSIAVPDAVKIDRKTCKVTAIGAKAFSSARAKVKSATVGKNVAKIGAAAFTGCAKLKVLTLKTKKLTAKGVRGSLKGSKVTTVKVKVGTVAQNKKYASAYTKYFVKANSGRKVDVK